MGQDPASFVPFLVIIVLLFGVIYFFSIKPQQKKQKEHQEFVDGLRRGDKVVTTGGIYGTVERIGKESILLQIESGAGLRVSRDSIVRKQGK